MEQSSVVYQSSVVGNQSSEFGVILLGLNHTLRNVVGWH